jgi:hypothetical protein
MCCNVPMQQVGLRDLGLAARRGLAQVDARECAEIALIGRSVASPGPTQAGARADVTT